MLNEWTNKQMNAATSTEHHNSTAWKSEALFHPDFTLAMSVTQTGLCASLSPSLMMNKNVDSKTNLKGLVSQYSGFNIVLCKMVVVVQSLGHV